jgi:hypothetical protein
LKSFHLELHNLAGLCGSLQYAAVHSRPDIATKVASLQKGITTATVETLMEGNKVLKEAQTYADTSVHVQWPTYALPVLEMPVLLPQNNYQLNKDCL